jgi:prephenate dehydrogenase
MRSLTGSRIVIAGLGLIGGSLARALKSNHIDCHITGVGRRTEVLEQARQDGSIDAFHTDLAAACAGADIILLAVPVLTIRDQLLQLVPVLDSKTIITDAASVKQHIVDDARAVFGEIPANFVPGHPIAGSEQSGYEASRPGLFTNRKVILTPLEHTNAEAVSLVSAMWVAAGAQVLQMGIRRHDEVLAATSHLPHLLAFALVDTLSQHGESEDIFRYAAGGLRDFTRIASSDPVMWRDIFLTNADATVAILDEYVSDLESLRDCLQRRDGEALISMFRRANKSRANFLSMLQSAAPQVMDSGKE